MRNKTSSPLAKKKIFLRFLRGAGCLLFWLLLWQVLAMALSKALVLPTPLAVGGHLLTLLGESDFIITCLFSLFRIFLGLLLGLLSGVLLAALSSLFRTADALLTPLVSVIKATPVASVILVMLFVLGKSAVPTVAAWLMVIPIVYMNVRRGISSVPVPVREVAQVYGFGPCKRLRLCVMPAVLPYFSAACRSCLGLAWKAGVAAEVICTPLRSIGGKLYDAKVYLESEDLFAWTVVVILLSLLIEKGMAALLARLAGKGDEPLAEA